MTKVILFSQKPLPYHHIGSWTTMYKNYFETAEVLIDTIICETPQARFKNVEYSIVSNSLITKFKRKLTKNPYIIFIECLVKYLKPNENYIIQIVDNFGLAKALYKYLIKYPSLRKQLYIQFFYHGYPPFYGNFESRWFFEFIDEMVLLTHSAYIEHKNTYTILPCLFSVLHNGIDTSKFYKVSEQKKNELKQKHNVENKIVFLWCSQDRPKKGLDLILNVWKHLLQKHNNIELWVIGAKRDLTIEHVTFFGKLPNASLPEYYQTADSYLFPVLNHEGFGMSLIEALHCGAHCIASALGGVPEVLQEGEFGTLVLNPHFIIEWVNAIDTYLENKTANPTSNINLYAKENWVDGMNKIINNAKFLMN